MNTHGTDTDVSDGPSPISGLALPRRAMIAIACLTATLSSALLYDVLPPIMRDLAEHFGGAAHGRFIAQLAGTLPLFGVMMAGLTAGFLVERFGLRPTLLFAMVLFGVAGSAGATLDDPTMFLASRFLMGCGAGLMTTACNSLVAIFFRGAPRARMNGVIISAGAIGGIGFVLIAGWAAGWSWRAPFLLHGAIVVLFLLPVLLTGRVPATAAIETTALANFKRLRPMLPVCAAGFGWFVLMLMGGVQAPLVMTDSGIHEHGTIASIYALNAASVSLSSLVFGHFASRFDPIATLRVAFMMMAVGLCLIASATTAPMFAAAMAWNGITIGIGLTALWTWGMRRAPHDLVARSLGAMTTSLYLGGAVMPFVTAPYHAAFGTRGQFFGVAATVVVIVAIISILARLRPARPVKRGTAPATT